MPAVWIPGYFPIVNTIPIANSTRKSFSFPCFSNNPWSMPGTNLRGLRASPAAPAATARPAASTSSAPEVFSAAFAPEVFSAVFAPAIFPDRSPAFTSSPILRTRYEAAITIISIHSPSKAATKNLVAGNLLAWLQ